ARDDGLDARDLGGGNRRVPFRGGGDLRRRRGGTVAPGGRDGNGRTALARARHPRLTRGQTPALRDESRGATSRRAGSDPCCSGPAGTRGDGARWETTG